MEADLSDGEESGAAVTLTIRSSDAHSLPPKQLLMLLNRGNREVGAVTIKNTLAIVRALSAASSATAPVAVPGAVSVARPSLDPEPDLGLYLLQIAADIMRREAETLRAGDQGLVGQQRRNQRR